MVKFDESYSNSHIAELHRKEEERSIQTKSDQLGYNYVNLIGYTLNPEALAAIQEAEAKDSEVVGFELKRKNLSLATKNPNSPKTQALILSLQKQRYSVSVYMCSTTSLAHAWERYSDINGSKSGKKGVFEISSEDITKLQSQIKKTDDVAIVLNNIRTANNSRRISETLELIFAGGLALGASDVHIEPEQESVRLRYRFDGVLHDIADIDSFIYKRIISRLKLLSGMVLNTRKEAQDGRFTFDTKEKVVEVRSSIIPGAAGESIVMRLLDPSVASFSLDKINLNPYIRKSLEQQLHRPNGLIITTGPTGSGKTTALYAFLKETHAEGIKIITIENPVEYKLEGIVQTQTGDDYTFSSGLRAILRQDPDVIMIGEIRDHEVAETAIHAAQTGHLVFSTLHTNSAIAGFPRLIDLGVDPRIMGSSINMMLGQRLVRILCPNCKTSYTPNKNDEALLRLILSEHPFPPTVPETINLFKATGCEACGNTGYKGRTGIFEGVVVDQAVEEAVLRDPREHIIREAAKPQKIPSMLQDGGNKVLQGETSLEELERVIELPRKKLEDLTESEIKKTPSERNTSEDDFLSHVV